MLKNKVLVFVLLALAALLLQIILSLGKPDGPSKSCCSPSLNFFSNNPSESPEERQPLRLKFGIQSNETACGADL